MVNNLEKQNLSKKLLYTWQKCFAKTQKNNRSTDFIGHSINFKPNAYGSYSKIPHYIMKKYQFCDHIFPKIEEADIITQALSD